jgi:transcriptional regulator with XRE-family HTH domain
VPDMADLQQRIRQAADEAGGYRTLARRSGGRVSHSTLNNIVNGRHSGEVGRERIDGIALALGISAREVGEMLGVSAGDPPPPFVLPERARWLTQPQRRLVISMVDELLRVGKDELAEEFGQATAQARDRLQRERRGSAASTQQPRREAQ